MIHDNGDKFVGPDLDAWFILPQDLQAPPQRAKMGAVLKRVSTFWGKVLPSIDQQIYSDG